MPKRSNAVETTIEELVEQTKMGDKDVLEEIIWRIPTTPSRGLL